MMLYLCILKILIIHFSVGKVIVRALFILSADTIIFLITICTLCMYFYKVYLVLLIV